MRVVIEMTAEERKTLAKKLGFCPTCAFSLINGECPLRLCKWQFVSMEYTESKLYEEARERNIL